MTSHELAHKLLEQEDLDIYLPVRNTPSDVEIVMSFTEYVSLCELNIHTIVLEGEIK